MIELEIKSDGLHFVGMINDRPFHFNEWKETDDVIYYLPLSNLVDNGSADYRSNVCLVPFESIYLLNDRDRMILGIPDEYPYDIRLRSEGMLNERSFKYKLDFLSGGESGQLLQAERCGNILYVGDDKYTLSESRFLLCLLVDDFNSRSEEEKNFDFNLLAFAKIKDAAQAAGCFVDSYIDGENVRPADLIRIVLGREGDEFTILPEVDSLNEEENSIFKQVFGRSRRALDVYPLQDENGNRIRVPLTPGQREGLAGLKARGTRHTSPESVREIVENPTEFFDPDLFDLSDFYSDRVIEIGLYRPKFVPFLSPYKSNWCAGATVESPENGTTKIALVSEEELQKLLDAIAEAERIGSRNVNYGGCIIDIDDAKYLAAIARKQLDSPKAPVPDVGDKKVLIIEENAEHLGFMVETPKIEQGNRYTLFHNPRLDHHFRLKTHQQEGVAWLQHLYKSKAPGCLMADDMGLGKTLQILYFIDWHAQKYPDHKPYLIVAPVSLLENWRDEFERFFPTSDLKLKIYTSKDVPRQVNRVVIDRMQHEDIILSNYESIRNCQLNFCAVDFDIIVLDEAQRIKTPSTMVTHAAKALKGKFRIAMTGTPVENTLVDLWCIMDFCVPGLLGNCKSFSERYQNPLRNSDTDIIALGKEIHRKLGIYLMRRMKTEVAKDLPAKHVLKKVVEMPDVQHDTYLYALKCFETSIQPFILTVIQEIRAISEHPYLYDHTLNFRTPNEITDDSARVVATLEFLDDIKKKGEKVIIFVERKDSQRMLQNLMFSRYGIQAKIINGDTPTMTQLRTGKQSRQSAINEFQSEEGFNVIIMSPIAAGMGLNVTAANHVIHFSRHWNPAKENQATDRAYRIGQEKDVYVYYPMAVSSDFQAFDITLDELLDRKTALASSTIFPTERFEVRPDEIAQILFNH